MINKKSLLSIFLSTMTIGGCNMANKDIIPDQIRFGDMESTSNYILEKRNLDIISMYKDDELDGDIVKEVTVFYKNSQNPSDSLQKKPLVGPISIHLRYKPHHKKFKDKTDLYYQIYIDPDKYENSAITVEGLHTKEIIWFPKKNEKFPEDHYVIKGINQYDDIVVVRREVITTVSKVRSLIKKNIFIEFHFRSEKSAESDLIFINSIIEDISSHFKLIEGN
jgi:hypothetical protein